ncbi:FXYD domain-containing ion transport regulator 6-like isoform X1 [Sparus aurata]|uniref:FXYD domain-containing ion transport regulator n=1 Tax=Sparus aurata TaxID=8175 RepID=A0A671TTK9_SPAAU|nr:FXYD domain-containing ion transport regulator 6-like isoform X1 [Sparus aurata]
MSRTTFEWEKQPQGGTMDLVVLVAFSSWLAPALGSAFGREVFASTADKDKADYDSAFQYDYESLRIGGLVFAVVLFLMGIALIVTRKCSCSKSDQSRTRGPDVESVPRA